MGPPVTMAMGMSSSGSAPFILSQHIAEPNTQGIPSPPDGQVMAHAGMLQDQHSNGYPYTSMPTQSSMSTLGSGPYLRILEQPVGRIRYRYKSEKGSHGGLLGKHSTQTQKKYPKVELMNFIPGGATIVVKASLYTDEDNPKQHVHKLMGRECDPEHGCCMLELNTHDMTTTFQNLGILFVGKKEVPDILYKRKISNIGLHTAFPSGLSQLTEEDNTSLRDEANREAKGMNLNSVKIGFQAFTRSMEGDVPITQVEYSTAIANQKSPDSGELKITRMNKCSGVCTGDEEIFLLCEKVNKKDIKIRFYEMNASNEMIWWDFGKFRETDVHHQVAIVFRTPPYRQDITKPVEVYLELYRERNGNEDTSESWTFTYIPADLDIEGIERKRKKASNYDPGSGSPFGSHSMSHDESSDKPFGSVGSVAGDRTGSSSGSSMGGDPSIAGIGYTFQMSELLDDLDISQSLSPTLFDTADYQIGLKSTSHDPVLASSNPNAHILYGLQSSQASLPDLPGNVFEFLESDSVAVRTGDRGVDTCTSGLQSLSLENNQGIKPKIHSKDEQVQSKSSGGSVPRPNKQHSSLHLVKRLAASTAAALQRFIVMGDIRQLLLSMRHLIGIPNTEGDNCLHLAVLHQPDKPQILKCLLDSLLHQDYVNHRNNLYQSPLHLAVLVKNPHFIQLLLQAGADINVQDRHGNTAIHIAVCNRDYKCLAQLLRDSGQKQYLTALRTLNFEGSSPLHVAVQNSDRDCIDLLIKTDPTLLNVKDGTSGQTPMHFAVENGLETVQMLLPHLPSVRLDVQNYAGNTPLHLACAYGSESVVKLLIDHGADPTITNFVWEETDAYGGQRAADLTMNPKILQLLSTRASKETRPQLTQLPAECLELPDITKAGISVQDKDVLPPAKDEAFDSGYKSRELSEQSISPRIMDRLCQHLDPPNPKFQMLALCLGFDDTVIEESERNEKPTKCLIKRYLCEGDIDMLKEAMRAADIETSVIKILESDD